MTLPDKSKPGRDASSFAFVQVALTSPGDRDRFLRVLSDFAARLDLASQPGPIFLDGRQLPGPYSSRDLLLSQLIADYSSDSKAHYAQARLELRRRRFPLDQFRNIATDFLAAMRTEFGAQIRMVHEPHRPA